MVKYWKLFPVEYDENDPNKIATAAILKCSFCHETISGMNGPGTNVMCEKCHDVCKSWLV